MSGPSASAAASPALSAAASLRFSGSWATAASRITIPNPASLALHRSLGFQEEGRYTATGFKLGQWRDMAELSLVLAPRQGEPEPVRPVSTLSPELVGEILARQLPNIR